MGVYALKQTQERGPIGPTPVHQGLRESTLVDSTFPIWLEYQTMVHMIEWEMSEGTH